MMKGYYSLLRIFAFCNQIVVEVMTRYFAVLVLCSVLLIGVFNGCNDTAGDKDGNTIVFWHFWSEPSQKAAIKTLLEKFEKENNCKVQTTELSWNDGKTKLFASFNSNTAPDVIELGSDWVAQFSSSGVLSTVQQSELNRFVDYSIAPAKWNSAYYAVPWVVDTRVMFCNTELMTKAGITSIPQNVSQLRNAVQAMSSLPEGTYGFGANGADAHRLYKKILPFFWSNGGDIFDKNGNLTLYSPQNVSALNEYVTLSRYGLIETQRHLDEAFVQGKIGFWYSGGWLMKKIADGNPSLKYSVALIPGMQLPSMSFAGGEYLAVNAKTKKKELAEKLVHFLTDGKNALEFCKSIPEAGFPANKSTINDTYFKSVKNRDVFANQLQNARMTPVHPRWLDIEAVLENAVTASLLGEKSAELALADAQRDAETYVNAKK